MTWVERERATENAAVAELLLREDLAALGNDRDVLATLPLKADREVATFLEEAEPKAEAEPETEETA